MDKLPASSSASEAAADSVEADLETGVGEWRRRGLPPAQSKAQRWGAPYHQQFAILFTRCASCLFPLLSLHMLYLLSLWCQINKHACRRSLST